MQVVCPGIPRMPAEEETKKKKDAGNGVSKVLMLLSKPARKTNLKMFQGPRRNSVMQEIDLEAEGEGRPCPSASQSPFPGVIRMKSHSQEAYLYLLSKDDVLAH